MELYRAIVELRYVAPRYLDARSAVITEFMTQYPEFALEFGPDQLRQAINMRNDQRGVHVFAHGFHCGLEMSFEPFDLEAFSRDAGKFCRAVARDILRVEVVERIGMRFFYRSPAPERDPVSLILQHLLRPSASLGSLNITDANWDLAFTANDEYFAYLLRVAPERAKRDGEQDDFTGNLILDIDVHQSDKPVAAVTSLRETIQGAKKQSLAMGEQLLKGLFQ